MKAVFYPVIILVALLPVSFVDAFAQDEGGGNTPYAIPKWLADKSPLKQHIAGIAASTVVCQENLQLVIEKESDFPACVRPETARVLVERGWVENTVNTVYAALEQDYHAIQYANGTEFDSYDIDAKIGNFSMQDPLYFHIFLPNGTLYKNDTVLPSEILQDGSYRYHVDVMPDRMAGTNAFKAVVSYRNGSSTVYMPPPPSEPQDIFGIREIYPTAGGGAQWYMNAGDVANDTLFSTVPDPSATCDNPMLCTLFYKNPDGSWHAGRADVPENEGIRMIVNAPPGTLWLNTEMTGYYRLQNSTHYPQELTHVIRSGTPHSSVCQGYSYYLSITYDGNIAETQKSLYHAGDASSYSETFTASGITSPLDNRWIGMKTIVYNLNDTAVKLEIWLDDQDNNDWHKVSEQVDTGWPVPGNPAAQGCKNIMTGHPMGNKDVISWGGTEQQFRADNAEMDFKDLSIREISPPAS